MSITRPLLTFIAAALLPAATAPQPPPLTFEAARQPLPLAERLLGRPAPEIIEAEAVPTPGVAQWASVELYFAPHAHATERSGLCRLEMQHVGLSFVEPRDRAGTLLPSPPETIIFYALTVAAPDLGAANRNRSVDETACRGLTPFLNRPNWRLVTATFEGHLANPAQVAFAFQALAAARTIENVQADSCPTGDGPACVDARAFLRAVDLRDLFSLRIARCATAAPQLCVIGATMNGDHDGYVELRVELDDVEIPSAGASPRLRAVSIATGRYPVA